MDLNQIVNTVQILGILVLIYGMWLALKQFKLLRNQRRDLAIMECARSFEDKEFTEAYALLTNLNIGTTMKQMNSLGIEYQNAALRTGMKFETIGLLVFKGVVPIDAMEDLVGSASINIWNSLKVWVYETRVERSHPTFLEWYEWLVDRLIERGNSNRIPAYEKYKNWNSNTF